MEGYTMHGPTNFAHRHNADGTYDSICLKCYATAARAKKEESLSSPESAHVCDPTALYLADQGSVPVGVPMLGLIVEGSSAQVPPPHNGLPPYLITSRGVKRCSVCQQPFEADSKPSMSAAFKKHVLNVHRAKEGLGQNGAKTKEDRAD
jgi:hypothetical protein